ncbi:MAG: dehydratase [Dehalococcoidia bacterium]|jgi:acyl dehydratase|nr:dehydratase [Dehalococcoidia bacterium]
MAEQVYYENVNVGDEIPKLVKNCSTQQLVMWAAGAGDFYQIHYDKDFALALGTLPGLIVHGALKHAFLGQMLHDWIGEKGQIKTYGCQYRGMDVPGQEITCRGVITNKLQEGGQNLVELDIWTEIPSGDKTTPGKATVILPSR